MHTLAISGLRKNRTFMTLLCIAFITCTTIACKKEQITKTILVVGGIAAAATAGYLIAKYLTAEEKQSYETDTKKSLAQKADNQSIIATWHNADGTKEVTNASSEAVPLNVASQRAKEQGITVDSNNLSAANVPNNSSCRMVESTMQQNGKPPIKESALWCRDAQGDYARVNGVELASR